MPFATIGPDAWSASQQQGRAYGEPVRVLTVLRRGDREVGRHERLYGIRCRPALPGPLPGGAVVQAAGAGRLAGFAPAHRRRQLPGQLRRAPPGLGGIGPARSIRKCGSAAQPYSVSLAALPLLPRGRLSDRPPTSLQPPFRAPHHSASQPGRRADRARPYVLGPSARWVATGLPRPRRSMRSATLRIQPAPASARWRCSRCRSVRPRQSPGVHVTGGAHGVRGRAARSKEHIAHSGRRRELDG